jgi:hypothetical protein
MYLQKVISQKKILNYFFVGISKINDENSRIQDPDPDPLVSGMDPQIWIHTKMSWIRGSGSTPKCHGSGTLGKTDGDSLKSRT